MFLGWIYEYVFAVVVSAIALLYNVYCFIGLIMYNKNKNAITAKFNSYIWLAKKMAGKQSNNEKKLKKYSKLLRKVNIGVIVLMTGILIMNIVLLSIIYMLNIQATNISNILTTLFGKSDCSCYAKCTGDEEDDAKTAYELLFGPTEYDKFTEAVMKDMLPSDAQPFVDMIANEANGKEQGEWLIAHLNDDAVQCYKEIVGDNNKFRAGDHQDRSKMTNGELKDDLIALLKDYKVGGRNPNCERCFDVEDHQLATKCIGEAHWVPGWTWEAIWDSDNPGDGSEEEPGDNSGGNVAAKDSQYGVELDGEWYYWYHQKAEGCVNDVKHDTYGHYGSLWIVSGTAAARGCSSYSSAMAISNAVGAEVTPYVLLEDIMGGTFSQGSSGWQFNNNATQYIDYKENAINMKKDALSKRVEEWCHSKGYTGIHTEYIPNPSQAKIDEVLSKGGYIVASWFHDTSNGIAWYPKLSSGSGSHFMVIRKKDANGLYYCLNSAEGHDHTRSKAGITYSEMASTMYNTTWWGWAIWNDNPPSTNPGDGNGDGGGDVELTVEAAKVREILQNSEFSAKADAMAQAFSEIQPVLGTNAAIGLMANINSEGNYAIVEEKFSNQASNIFPGPKWARRCVDLSGLNWLESKGSGISCGFGIIQWSYDRRMQLVAIYKSKLGGATQFSEALSMSAEIQMMVRELSPGTSYYGNVSKAANNAGGSPENWAEAFCDYYEMPSGWCGKHNRMTGIGSGCRERMATASRLVQLLGQ